MSSDGRRKLWRTIAICGGFFALLVAGFMALKILRSSFAGTSQSPPDDLLRPAQVEVATVEKSTLHPALDLVGQIIAMPERTAVVSSQSGGWVSSVAVVEEQIVRAGDILVTLDSRLANSDLRRAKAAMSEKQATLAKLKQGYLPEEIDASRQVREAARANLDSLRTEVSALEELRNRNEISKVQYVTKQKALQAAQANLAAADANVQLMEHGTRPEMIAEAQAHVDVAAADVNAAQLAVDWCTIHSPIDGIVVQLSARRGQFVDRAVSLATVTDLSEVFAQLRIPNDALANVRIETPVEVRVTAFQGEAFAGNVTRRSGEADPMSGDLTMYVTVKNPDGRLRPGLGCRAKVWLPPVTDALSVPVSAIADRDGTAVVTVIRERNAKEKEVKVGIQTGGRAQIIAGLAEGDVVATKGGYGLPDGYPVETVMQPGGSHN